ncbi:hypothetical protein AMECASPLE_003556 [Ameca splendens]|uniref:Secreted protein n=1 Tax=Ameca splendens TaxID=208324 RepID=A0ABV0ZID1_9TELE
MTLDCPVLFLISPGEMLLALSVFQDCLNTRNAKAPVHVLGYNFHTHSPCLCVMALDVLISAAVFTPCESSPVSLMVFASQSSQGCTYHHCLCTFFYQTISFHSIFHE